MYDLPSTNKTKKMDLFIFLFPNLPQIWLMNYIDMKSANIQGFIFLVYRIIKVRSLEEKGQYVAITFTTTYNYLVFVTKFLLSTTIVTSCWHQSSHLRLTYD